MKCLKDEEPYKLTRYNKQGRNYFNTELLQAGQCWGRALWPDQPFEGAALEMRPSVEGEESDHIYQG